MDPNALTQARRLPGFQSGEVHCQPAPPGSPLATASGRALLLALVLLPILLTAACSGNRRPAPPSGPAGIGSGIERGTASWYGPGFNGHRTANGERYNMRELTAAHQTLPFGSLVEVRNLESGRAIVVRINDRGPFAKGRVIDLSYAAAREVGVFGPGTAEVELRVLGADPAAQTTRFTVQVGAFADPDLALILHRNLKRMYPEAFIHADGIWNRVQIGLFDDRDNAESLRRELAAMGMNAVVVVAQ
jgi:peptidoglycan lytic transglycosylase